MTTIEEIRVRLNFETLKGQKELKKMKESLKGFNKGVNQTTQGMNRLKAYMNKSQAQFSGWAMSIMFFGMAITRVFKGIMDAGVKTFQDVARSVDGTVTPFDRLKGGMEILSYTIGNAISGYLEPLMPIIMKVVGVIADWIDQNPNLTSEIILWGLAIGGVLTAVGMLTLGIKGVIGTFNVWGDAMKLMKDVTPAITSFFSDLANTGWDKIRKGIDNMVDGMGKLMKLGWKELIGNIKWIRNNPIKGLVVAGVVTGIIAAILWMIRLKETMGTWGDFWKNVLRGAMRAFAMFSSYIRSRFLVAIEEIQVLMNKLISGWNKLPFADKIEKIQVTGMNFDQAYAEGMHAWDKWIDDKLGTPETGWTDTMNPADIWNANLFDDDETGITVINNYYNPNGDELNNDITRVGNV